jgi:DNA-binding beta-propeller fold protein YncE
MYEPQADWGQGPSDRAAGQVADVAVDGEDRVYLLTRGENRVWVYDRGGRLLKSWTHARLGPGGHGIAVDDDLNVFIVDWQMHCVIKFTSDGDEIFVLGAPGIPADTGVEPWPPRKAPYPLGRLSQLYSAGPFNGCTQLAFGPGGELFVSDGYGNARIHRFSADGELLNSWGEPGRDPGQFHNPHGVHIASDGLMYVSDRENDRIQVFTLDFEFVRELHVQRPANVAIDRDGRIAVASLRYEPGDETFTRGRVEARVPDRFTVFGPSGAILFDAEDAIQVPNGIAVDSRGDVYVAQVGSYDHVNRPGANNRRGERAHAPIAKFSRLV